MRDVHPTVPLNHRPAALQRVRHNWFHQWDSMGLEHHPAKSLPSPLQLVLSHIGRRSSRCFLQTCPDTSFHLCQPLPKLQENNFLHHRLHEIEAKHCTCGLSLKTQLPRCYPATLTLIFGSKYIWKQTCEIPFVPRTF